MQAGNSTGSSSTEHKHHHHHHHKHHHRQAPAPPTRNGNTDHKSARRKAPTPPISPTSSSTAKENDSGPTSPHHQQSHQLQEDKRSDSPVDTSSYVVVEKQLDDIVKEFDATVGTELVEIVRTKLVCHLSSYMSFAYNTYIMVCTLLYVHNILHMHGYVVACVVTDYVYVCLYFMCPIAVISVTQNHLLQFR